MNGLIKRALERNWKTSTAGIASMAFSFIALFPNRFWGEDALIVEVSKFAIAGGLAALGILAKDYNVTGTGRDRS